MQAEEFCEVIDRKTVSKIAICREFDLKSFWVRSCVATTIEKSCANIFLGDYRVSSGCKVASHRSFFWCSKFDFVSLRLSQWSIASLFRDDSCLMQNPLLDRFSRVTENCTKLYSFSAQLYTTSHEPGLYWFSLGRELWLSGQLFSSQARTNEGGANWSCKLLRSCKVFSFNFVEFLKNNFHWVVMHWTSISVSFSPPWPSRAGGSQEPPGVSCAAIWHHKWLRSQLRLWFASLILKMVAHGYGLFFRGTKRPQLYGKPDALFVNTLRWAGSNIE
jgi:hypothetical protein